jgi:kynurenine formamidase
MKMKTLQTKLIDLTRLINENIPVYPDTVSPSFEVLNTVEKNGFAELKMNLVLHTGTHIDAPCHMLTNAKSIDQFPIDKFIGRGMIIPCSHKEEIDLVYLQTFEDKIAQVEFVLFYTGWQNKWNTKEYFNDCPTLTPEAAEWLTKFRLKGIGIDAFSLDKVSSAEIVKSEDFPNHHTLLKQEILLIENLTNLDKIPDSGFMFQCFPLNIENADGSPVRAIATFNTSVYES